jgi:hypothetical protein
MSYCVSCKQRTPDVKKNVYYDEASNRIISKALCSYCGAKKSQFSSIKDLKLHEKGNKPSKVSYSEGNKPSKVSYSEGDKSDYESDEESDEEYSEEDDEEYDDDEE